jgi:NAD(P)-dependent dehydrogenase (short-subunit alcohol dehydrogenase family)
VTEDASIADAARQVGTLDILVNSADISGDGKTPDQEDAGTFRRIYEANVFGVAASTPKARGRDSCKGRLRQRCQPPAVLQALSRNSSGSPVSTRLLRLDKIIGQPGVMTFSSDPPGSSPR